MQGVFLNKYPILKVFVVINVVFVMRAVRDKVYNIYYFVPYPNYQ